MPETELHGARGSQIGDRNTQVNFFRAAVSERPCTPCTLPRRVITFRGREAELERLTVALADGGESDGTPDCGIFVISGMAGVGKTALALCAAHQVANRFPGGQLFLDLRGYTDGLAPLTAAEALSSLLRSLGVPPNVIPGETAEREAFYRNRLAGTETLIILDNAGSAAQVLPLLPGTVGCLVIVTSRRSLSGLDDHQAVPLQGLPADKAIELFRSVVGPGRVAPDAPALARVVALCGYLPLALRIVAAWMRRRPALPIEEVAEEMSQDDRLLTMIRDDARDLTSILHLSYQDIPAPQQRLFRLLGKIPGPDFDHYTAACTADIELGRARQMLDSLLDCNLLEDVCGRYRFHDLVRAYVRTATLPRSRTTDSALEAAAALDRLRGYYLHCALAADEHFARYAPRTTKSAGVPPPRVARPLGDAGQARAWVAGDLANLDAAARHAAAAGRPGYAVAMAAALAQYLRAYGPWGQALSLHTMALSAAEDTRDVVGSQAGALADRGAIHRYIGELAAAEADLTRSLGLYRQAGDRDGQSRALVDLGIVLRLTGQIIRAEECLLEALELYSQLDSRQGQAAALAELGNLQRHQGLFRLAEESITRALRLYHALGHRWGEAAALAYLASVHWATGTLGPARESAGGALFISRDLGDLNGQANALLILGGAARDAGDHALAATSLAEALGIYRNFGDRRGQANALSLLGRLQQLSGDYEHAGESLAQALVLLRELLDRGGEAETLRYCAQLAAATGALTTARDRYTQSLELALEIPSAKDEADSLSGLAAIDRLEGGVESASARLRRALALYESMDCRADADRVRAILADVDPGQSASS